MFGEGHGSFHISGTLTEKITFLLMWMGRNALSDPGRYAAWLWYTVCANAVLNGCFIWLHYIVQAFPFVLSTPAGNSLAGWLDFSSSGSKSLTIHTPRLNCNTSHIALDVSKPLWLSCGSSFTLWTLEAVCLKFALTWHFVNFISSTNLRPTNG